MVDTKKVATYLTTAKITPIQFLFSMISIVLFIFLGTSIFEGITDGWKIVVYAAATITAVLGGLNINYKKLVTDLRDTWLDQKLSPQEKIRKLGNIIISAAVKVGEAWEEVNIQQGTDPREYADSSTV